MKLFSYKAGKKSIFLDCFFYLGLLFYIVLAFYSHKLNYRPFGDRDLPSYLFEWRSLEYILSQHRTIGLPLFLQLFISNNISFNLWPYFQFSVMILSILYLRYCFKKILRNNFFILLLSILFLLMTFQERFNIVMSEPLGFAALNFSLGAFLLSIMRRKKIDFFVLIFFTFLSYQIRPAFIVLPFAFFFCLMYLFLLRKISKKNIIYFSFLLFSPLILFMGLRLFLVNQFNLVAFTGTSISGHAVMYLNDKTIDKLPEKDKIFASKILEAKKKLLPQMTENFDCRVLNNFSIHQSKTVFDRYNQEYRCWNFLGMTAWVNTINHIKGTWPLQDINQNIDPWNHVYTLSSYFSGDNVETDIYLTYLSVEIIKKEFRKYLDWIFISTIYAPLAYLFSTSRFYLSCFLISVMLIIAYLNRTKEVFLSIDKSDEFILMDILFAFSIFFLLLSLIPIIAIAAPLPRYLFAAFYFFYPAFILWAFLKLNKYRALLA